MTIPDFQSCMLPILKLLQTGSEFAMKDGTDGICDAFQMTEEKRQQMLPSGQARVIANRVAWAKKYLMEAGLT